MIGILIVTLLAFFLSLIIVILDSKLQNKREGKILELLPGYNCGACGFGSCSGMAKKICEDINAYKKCKPLKGENLEKMQAYINSLK
ncbi:MAG: hypothetical protein HFI86_07290 [Bacilli bacterium]|nr:hypothetical protein [Bacilli bacterium]MCI9435053.1 hypothetical protein [Bacilli bacterium]